MMDAVRLVTASLCECSDPRTAHAIVNAPSRGQHTAALNSTIRLLVASMSLARDAFMHPMAAAVVPERVRGRALEPNLTKK